MFLGSRRAWYADGTLRSYVVYILSNRSMTLYIGVTNDLERRLFEHRAGAEGFTSRYHIDRLVYFELFEDPDAAIAREKQLKRWRRDWKRTLIERENRGWNDLAARFGLDR